MQQRTPAPSATTLHRKKMVQRGSGLCLEFQTDLNIARTVHLGTDPEPQHPKITKADTASGKLAASGSW
jgi:hypothetical protein